MASYAGRGRREGAPGVDRPGACGTRGPHGGITGFGVGLGVGGQNVVGDTVGLCDCGVGRGVGLGVGGGLGSARQHPNFLVGTRVGASANSRSVDAATVSRLYEKDLNAAARPAQSRTTRRIISDENGEGCGGRKVVARLNWIWLCLEFKPDLQFRRLLLTERASVVCR